ncbi:MFS transporter [Variovorax sp. J22R133]|uniref:MFS transporter n=1 Tax=Variovorax brevis TaxID=3053503 RepID=UPI002574AF59|nr:MFS transporter [Variovorax sp. J22R133]MDM0116292.1 MFS transporter [Variovorax sp. J22R133]
MISKDPLRRIGFAEIFWADIPKAVVRQEDLLEETKAWGRTVVGRAQSAYESMLNQAGKLGNPAEQQFTPQDFDMGIAVVDEIVETVGVMDGLFFLLGKMGLFKFDLAPLLRDYIGDVQLVADFPFQRDKILFRFHSALGKIVEAFAKHNSMHKGPARPEIYIVAHSEGTVISFLGMLEAFTGKAVCDPEGKDKKVYESKSWIGDVHGYMTIGSPIDKHIVLWPGLWTEFEGKLTTTTSAKNGAIAFAGAGVTLGQKIKWRNYFDFGDPIGFQLDTAVELLCRNRCGAFEFVTKEHDIGFSRYWLPGKAHNDYWTDKDVFGHFNDDVVSPRTARLPAHPPTNRPLRGGISTAIPYLLCFLVHLGAVFALYKGIVAIDVKQQYANATIPLLLLSVLLFAITVGARIPRLVKTEGSIRCHCIALAFFAVGAACIWGLPNETVAYLAVPFVQPLDGLLPTVDGSVGSLAAHGEQLKSIFAATCFVITLSGWVVYRKPKYGRRALLIIGGSVVLYIVLTQSLGVARVPTWPMVLAGLAFLYLWWLGILLFDLAFVWHRYIRNSVAIDIVRQWHRGQDVKRRTPRDRWNRPAPPQSQAP